MEALLTDIRELILSSRKAVVHSVDSIQVFANFEIDRRIVEHEQRGAARAGFSEAIFRELATALTAEFGKSFSLTNLKLIRQFYLSYRQQVGQTPSGVLPLLQKSQTLAEPSEKSHTLSRESLPPVT